MSLHQPTNRQGSEAYAVCSALLGMSVSRPLQSCRAGVLPVPTNEFGLVTTAQRLPHRTLGDIDRPTQRRTGGSAPPRCWSRPRLSRNSEKPEHKWAHRVRLGWFRLKARLAARKYSHPTHAHGGVRIPPFDEVTIAETDLNMSDLDWVDSDAGVHVFRWEPSEDWDMRSARSSSSVSLPLFLELDSEVDVSITVTPPTPARFHFPPEPESLTRTPRSVHGTPTLFPPSNARLLR